jgi:hypothetical protein
MSIQVKEENKVSEINPWVIPSFKKCLLSIISRSVIMLEPVLSNMATITAYDDSNSN